MADDNASQYRQRWKAADQARLEQWLNRPIAPVEEAPAPAAPAKPQGTLERVLRFGPGVEVTGKMEEAGGKALRDAFVEGATNFVKGMGVPKSVTDLSGFGQSVLGVLQMASALPAGAGAAVQAALEHYKPGMDAETAIPGGAPGETTAAGYVRSILAAPSLVLDPKVQAARREHPELVAAELNKPITYGELLNIVTQFAVGSVGARGARRGRPGEPAGPKVVEGEVVEPGAAAPPPRAALDMPVVEGEVVRPPAALPPGEGPSPAALPPRGPLVTPPPEVPRGIPLGESPLTMGPEQIAMHLRDTLEQVPRRPTAEVLRERAAPGEVAPAAAEAVPEAPSAAEPTTLPATLERAQTRVEEVITEELAKPEVASEVAAATPEAAPGASEVPTVVAEAVPEAAPAAAGEVVPAAATTGPKAPATMAGAAINKELDALDKKDSTLTQKLIDAGRGSERPTETWTKTDPLSQEFKRLQDRRAKLRAEIDARYGPGAPSRLPKGFGPRERGSIDPALLARMALGAAAGGTQGDTPEERIVNAFLGMGLGAVLSKRLALRVRDAYKESGLADETGAIDFSKFKRPSEAAQRPSATAQAAAAEAEFQPNYARIASTADVRAFSQNLHRQIKDQILAARGGPKTHEATVLAAQDLITSGKMTPERLLNIGAEEMFTREQWTAARMIGAEAVVALKKANEDYKAGRLTGAQLEDQTAITTAVAQNVLVMRKRIAQTQEAGKIIVSGEGGVPYRAEDLIRLSRDNEGNAAAISKALDFAESATETGKVLTTAGVFPRAFLEFMYFSYLSGKSSLRNVVGNFLMQPNSIAVAAIAPYMPRGFPAPKWFPGRTPPEAWNRPGVVPGTATQMAIGWAEGMIDAFRLLKLWDEPTRQELLAMPDQWGQRQIETRYLPAITGENFAEAFPTLDGLAPGLSTAIDYMGKGMRSVPEGMGIVDALFKMTNARMWQRAEAFRQATLEGLADDAHMKRVDDLMNDWTLFDAEARDRIMDFAHSETLTKSFTGEWLARIAAGPENPWWQAFYRFSLVPFARTSLRGAEKTFLHTPLLNFTMAQFWRDMKMGGAEAQTAWARVAYGGMLMTLFGYLESRGEITGDEPDDPKMKQLWKQNGYLPRTFGVWGTDQRFSYDNLGPITDLIRYGANMSMALRRGATDGLHAFLTGAMVIATTFDTRSYSQTIQEFFDMMRGGRYGGDKGEAVMEWLRKKGSVVVPAAVRELEGAWDPAQRTVRPGDKTLLDELKTYMRDVMTKVPGWSSATDADGHPLAPPDLNVFTGEEIIGETWPFSPVLMATPKYHPVIDEVGRLQGAGLQMLPPNFLGGAVPKDQGGSGLEAPPVEENVIGGVRLEPWQRHRYTKLMTQEVRDDDGHHYMEALTQAIASDDYKAQSDIGPSGTPRDGGKAIYLQRIERDFMKRAELALHEEVPSIPKEIERRRAERGARKTPTADQPGVRQLIQSLGIGR